MNNMKFFDSFRNLFSKKEEQKERIEQVQKTAGQNLNAKIQADIKKEKTKEKLTIEDFDRENEEAKEKEMRELIQIKRRQTIKADEAKKRNKTLSSNF